MKRIFVFILTLLMICVPALGESGLPAVAEYAGGSIAYLDAWEKYSETMQIYLEFGWDESAADPALIAQQVLEDMVQDAVLRDKAAELGLIQPTADRLAELQAEAEAAFETQVSYYTDFYRSEGMTDAEAQAAAADALREDGITPESILEALVGQQWRDALYDHVCAGLVIDETHILSYAQDLADSQAREFAENPFYFDYLYMNDDLIAYYPEGLRYIKHILIGFDAEQAQAYQDVVGDGTQAEADPAALDAVYAPLAERVAKVERLLSEGADFGELMRTCGADDFMLYEPYSTLGYIVQPGSELFVAEFVDACFALEAVGDISAPVRTPGGIHLILYAGDVPAGPVALESIAEAVAAEAQEQLLNDAFDAQVALWMEEAQPVYHPEYLLQ